MGCVPVMHCFVPVKNREGSGVLPCKLTDKLTCYCFVEAGRRHKSPGSETKDLDSHEPASTMYCVGTSSTPPVLQWLHGLT